MSVRIALAILFVLSACSRSRARLESPEEQRAFLEQIATQRGDSSLTLSYFALGNFTLDVRRYAIMVLGNRDPDHLSTMTLVAILTRGDEDESLRIQAGFSIGRSASRGAVPWLIELLGHEHDTIAVMSASDALFEIGSPAVEQLLSVALSHGTTSVRMRALQILKRIDDPRIRPRIQPLLGDPDGTVQQAARWFLEAR